MSDTTVNSSIRVEEWADQEMFEYVRMNPFKALMGTGENSPIQIKEDLTKKAGDRITISLVTRLTGDGVSDDATLEGNEESLGNYGHRISVHQLRHGVVVGEFESIKTKIDLLNAAKTMLRLWNMEKLRDLCIARMFSPVVDGLTTYSAASEAQKDAWLAAQCPSTANQRVLFGAAKSNNAANDHSTCLGLIDGTADDCHQDIISLLKRQAQSADPHIRPVTVQNSKGVAGEKFYCLMGSLPFRDLLSNMETTYQYAGDRGEANLLFAGGSITVGNVECIEVPEMDRLPASGGCLLENVGDSSTTEVEPIFFLGAQALGLAWAQHMQVKTDEFDYSNKRGVAVVEIRGCEKLMMNSYQHGMATGYVSAVGD